MIKRMAATISMLIGAMALSPSYASHPGHPGSEEEGLSGEDDEADTCGCKDAAEKDCKKHEHADGDKDHEHDCDKDD